MELFFDRRTWNILVREYRKLGIDDSFIDFFWTWRYSHLPILRLIDAKIPRASLYHAISTGYAGLAGVMARLKYGSPMILTEHGIYTNERRIEIEQARWIYERKVDRSLITATISPFRQMWITLFDHLGRMTYEYAEEIITLFGNNRAMQIAGGADPSRTRIIPNGIDLEAFPVKKSAQPRTGPFRIGFVGRVVPIKDVKTFIRACKIVYENRPDSEFRIIGPYDEDPEYFAECRSLVDMLGLEKCLKFTGRIDLRTEYPKLDVLVLTSISEGQPLVILEANYCGIPCVATDVGACSELLNGNLTEDRNLGPSGIVTPLANPEATAQSIMKILTTEGLKEKMGQAGIKRVERFYNEKDLTFAYLNLYRKYIG